MTTGYYVLAGGLGRLVSNFYTYDENFVSFDGLDILTDEGYVSVATDGTPTYHYYLRDHLGNVRVVFDQNGAIEQRNDYYPSGALMSTSTGGSVQPYKYNGKELVRTDHFDHYDYGARWMDPKIGARFTTMDPMCEEYYDISPYAYCAGNSVNLVDPDGRIIDLSMMNENEKNKYNEVIDVLLKSNYFKTMYSELEKSSDVYYVNLGVFYNKDGTLEPGRFKLDEKGGGNIYFNSKTPLNFNVAAEELFHAYQYENRNYYGNNSYNREFEAKTFAAIVCQDTNQGYGEYRGMQIFVDDVAIHSKYGDDKDIINRNGINSATFLIDYVYNSNRFAFYNILNNIGNVNYKSFTLTAPYSLIKVINKSNQ